MEWGIREFLNSATKLYPALVRDFIFKRADYALVNKDSLRMHLPFPCPEYIIFPQEFSNELMKTIREVPETKAFVNKWTADNNDNSEGFYKINKLLQNLLNGQTTENISAQENSKLFGDSKTDSAPSRFYVNPQLVQEIINELQAAAPSKTWIKRFLSDDKINRAIDINERIRNAEPENSSHSFSDTNEETHQQFLEALPEIIFAICIHRSGFDAEHEFCTKEGSNKKDSVDFKVKGKQKNYLIEIRSTRESKRLQDINKNKFKEVCIDREPYKNVQRLQRQILEKCTQKDAFGSYRPHKFSLKQEANDCHIIVVMPLAGEKLDMGVCEDVLYREYSHLERGLFHPSRVDEATQILQERIDCVVFINYNIFSDSLNTFSAKAQTCIKTLIQEIFDPHKLEVYFGYNPRYFDSNKSMPEFEAILATYFDAQNIFRIKTFAQT